MELTARYGLEFNPFLKNSKEILFEGTEYTEAKFRLDYLARTKGFGLLTGAPGRGKTTLVRSWSAGLNDLKILFNFEMDSRDRAVILLVGLPQLNNTLQLSIHEPLRQRIIMNYNIDGYSKEEGRAYIEWKLKKAGCTDPVFDDAAIEAILNASDGTARVISKLCNASLVIGHSQSADRITSDIVMQAINDSTLG
jgi:type II secretory pathway predicted ATPase ExeA